MYAEVAKRSEQTGCTRQALPICKTKPNTSNQLPKKETPTHAASTDWAAVINQVIIVWYKDKTTGKNNHGTTQ